MRIKTLEVAGFKPAFKGMRNPMNSWDKSDSGDCCDMDCNECLLNKNDDDCLIGGVQYSIGKNDMKLAQTLIKAGNEHCKFLRQIQVWADFDMPRCFWSEFDTYKIGTSSNSCSTMHKLLNNPEPIITDLFADCIEDLDVLAIVVTRLEVLRQKYRVTKDDRLLLRAKRLLPEGFLQLRTVNLNYQVIRNIYHQRKHHRLKEEWIDTFCEWVRTLPYAEELIIN